MNRRNLVFFATLAFAVVVAVIVCVELGDRMESQRCAAAVVATGEES